LAALPIADLHWVELRLDFVLARHELDHVLFCKGRI